MNKIFKIYLITFYTLITYTSTSQRLITGRVIDNETKKSIREATITLKGKDAHTTTNQVGFFQINSESTDSLVISHIDYETVTFKSPEANKFQIGLIKKPINIYQKGMNSFYRTFGETIRYPKDARVKNKQGYVYVSFQIDSLGHLKNLTLIKDIGYGCGKEVLQILESISKDFIPESNKNIYILPVLFKLGSNSDDFHTYEVKGQEKLLSGIVVTAMAILR